MTDRVTWEEAERVARDSTVDKYLENFANDPNYDNAVCLIRYIMENVKND